MRLTCAGLRPSEIAAELGLCPRTVGDYIWRLCQGLHIRGQLQLALWGTQNPQALTGGLATPGLYPLAPAPVTLPKVA